MNWKDKFVIYFMLVFVVIVFVFVFKALVPTEHSPSDLITNPKQNSIIGDFYE